MLFKIFSRNLSDARLYQCYTILKVTRRATPEEIRSSFYRLSKLAHPDNVDTGNHHRFLKLKEAYELIKDAPLKIDPRPISKRFRSVEYVGDEDVEEDLTYNGYIQRIRAISGELIPDPHYEPKLYSYPRNSIKNIVMGWFSKTLSRKAAIDRRKLKLHGAIYKKEENKF